MTSKFQSQKSIAMKKLQEAREKGEVDSTIVPLLEHINSLKDFYTTSSCAGRISLLHDLGSKMEDDWLGKWHREVDFEEVRDAMKETPLRGIIWFIYEPAIIHIVSRELDNAKNLLNISRGSGFKRVGIQSYKEERVLIEICSTERIDAPIINNGKILVDEEYLRYLVKLANQKFQKGQEKLERLERAFMKDLS